jgi:hypothetical protein
MYFIQIALSRPFTNEKVKHEMFGNKFNVCLMVEGSMKVRSNAFKHSFIIIKMLMVNSRGGYNHD